jgi:hypothetical protein
MMTLRENAFILRCEYIPWRQHEISLHNLNLKELEGIYTGGPDAY